MLYSHGEEKQQENQWGCKRNVGRRKTALLLFVSGVLVGVIVTLVPVIVLQHLLRSSHPHFSYVCPDAWVSFQGKCYYFSDTESDWNSSREHCQRLGASLATIDTKKEMVRAGREPQYQSAHQGPVPPNLPHAKAMRRCLCGKQQAAQGQCPVLISPLPAPTRRCPEPRSSRGRSLSTPFPTQH
ncbi:early activation antigen CD69-like, partial [Numida meleagris]|uniref:early activation antigen CD69-like n=1 Tax=Numida meleagris TaxID=8996 RepID=UPI000B3E38B3